MAKKVKVKVAEEVKAPPPVDLEAFRRQLIGEQQRINAGLQQIQAQAQQYIGQLNKNAGSLTVVNRMLGRADGDLS